jgi:CRISPR-associated endonuclease/helicase Cas3
MTFADFATLFRYVTTNPNPFPYQRRFADADELPELIHAPTGAGKTATAILGWLWRRFFHKNPTVNAATPRRLVYCLPMRVLVEQTRDEARKWLEKLELANDVKVHVLMGGEDVEEWDLDPEKPAVLIGTQDMLLSRALNRGYGMSRFRWPMHFGLLNNDCLWVLDEIQLMGTGLATSTQLQAFRESLGTFGTAKTVWMSATLLPRWLGSIDFRNRIEPELRLSKLELDPKADYQADGLRERWNAAKPLTATNRTVEETAKVAQFVKDNHKEGALTLAIVNTVDRSRELFAAIHKLYTPQVRRRRGMNVAPSGPTPIPDLKLIHSRFRPKEREAWRDWLTQDANSLRKAHPLGRIVVSTQVVEAGVDLSAQTLITELAPWPSLVQRFGRCNRRGEFLADNSAQVFWIDVPTPDDKKAAPYSKGELDAARQRIRTMMDVGLKSLTAFFDGLKESEREELFPFDPPHVIRRKDFIDVFDTTPDLAGNDIDVSRFIRDGDDIDVQVFWRTSEPPRGKLRAAAARRIAPVREELCPVKMGKEGGIRGFLESHTAYRWDSLASEWVKADAAGIYPGQVFWVTTADGWYDGTLGWNRGADWPAELWLRDPDGEDESETTEEPGYDTDLLSVYAWRSIAEHTLDVIAELDAILAHLRFENLPRAVLALAARWHDWGKAHEVFQNGIKDDPLAGFERPLDRAGKRDIAKAAPERFWGRYKRKIGDREVIIQHFRHELASALGVLTLLKNGQAPGQWSDLAPHLQNLALYLIASHHGKVRLSIRSMPEETTPNKPDALFARGVWQGDPLSAVDLGDGVTTPAVEKLDLSPMMLGRVDGRPSWVERVLGLRDGKELGPLKLAYLEALLRAADMRASKAADENAKGVQS